MIVTEPIFTRLTFAWQLLIKTSYTEFNKNLINDLVAVARSRTDVCTDVLSTRGVLVDIINKKLPVDLKVLM
jgi:hypothetical protein